MFTFMCKNVVLTFVTLGTLEKLVQNYSCISFTTGTSVARPLKFCISYCVIKSYLWSNFHCSIMSRSRVIEGSRCPSINCFQIWSTSTVLPTVFKLMTLRPHRLIEKHIPSVWNWLTCNRTEIHTLSYIIGHHEQTAPIPISKLKLQ